MRVKVKYVQRHFYIINFGIYRWYQAAIPIFDIRFGFGVMVKKLNQVLCRNFPFLWCFCSSSPPPPPPTKIKKFQESYHLMSSLQRFREHYFCLKWIGQILRSLAEKGETGRKYKDLRRGAIPISLCFFRKRSIMWAGQTKFLGSVWHASPTLYHCVK